MRGIYTAIAIAAFALTSACANTPRNQETFTRAALAGQFVPIPNVRGQSKEIIIKGCGAYTYKVNRTALGDALSRGLSDSIVDFTLRAVGIAVIGRDLGDFRDSFTTNAIGAGGRGAMNGFRANQARIRSSFSRCMAANGMPGEFAWGNPK
jgi:hypothetical protein